ncbi:MAG TPA: sugar phosphate isomerase/epimerase family protein [Phenylobacterium sp.]|uniref:sugar phosphate isomerase/epimerase family protein n=1 Tax=Phenylobacterium sp. TaxID=1871053 RepID=UPI002B48AC1E|nr:sugar phosphate isomerase/epimerase family protein [Phenylobacterium sp.]HKR87925.1 sugar phosphate isomerase/epimerase family protein [Phenylobacterium sp.]
MPKFALRYAPHLGYIDPTPLFAHSVGTNDPYAHARFASEQGFAGLFHPWVGSGSNEDIARFKAGLADFGLQAGTLSYASWDESMRPLWASRRPEDRQQLLEHVETSTRLASDLGAKSVAVLIFEDPAGGARQAQMDAARENLLFAAEIAGPRGVMLGLEPMVAVPGMLLQSAYTAAELIDSVDDPSVRLIFDTGHVASMDGSILKAQSDLERLVGVYQLADMPDRKEPGAGTLDLAELLARLIRMGHRGLVELEHGWSVDSAEAEAAGIRLLEQLDANAQKMAAEGASQTAV